MRQLSFPNGAVLTNAFDGLGRLTASHLRTSGGTLFDRHDYLYNQASQRTNQVRLDDSDVSYSYERLGQLKTALGRHGTTNRWHERFGCAYARESVDLRYCNQQRQSLDEVGVSI